MNREQLALLNEVLVGCGKRKKELTGFIDHLYRADCIRDDEDGNLIFLVLNNVHGKLGYFQPGKSFLSEKIGEFRNLTQLSVNDNKLSGCIPSAIGELLFCTRLDLSKNNLRGEIPQSIGNMRELQKLELHENELVGAVPNSLENLSKLTHLDLSCNQLSDLNVDMSRLTSLRHLQLSHNCLIYLPDLGPLVRLEYLDVSYNQLEFRIPDYLSQLQDLKW